VGLRPAPDGVSAGPKPATSLSLGD
jgi:hypothetical protein